eukprot:TRINITY_DN1158_c1_g2_i1.p1 TRINITY_DN1158_c1_g2~~TRINITY_DN1158_c1_g2_i1.p1  ORF type:complete len:271 (-),score=84.14 TRINITY_DN1158_c1_g2_i1:159-854(-)
MEGKNEKVEVNSQVEKTNSIARRKLIVVLEGCHLEIIKMKDNYELLNSDDHATYMKKKRKRDAPGDARPDIAHQCLMSLLDSPINKAGCLQVYIHTVDNVLIEVNPSIRIPRTFKRFAGLMVQLLHKMNIKSADGKERLLSVIKNPIEQHFPANSRRVGMEFSAEKLVEIGDYVEANFKDEPVVFVIGGFSHGDVKVNYIEETISISSYGLSASVTCSKVCNAFEKHWGIL